MLSNKFSRVSRLSFSGGRYIEGLRMSFRVSRLIGDTFHQLKIEIYNVLLKKEGESQKFFKRGDPILLEAGYEENISILFSGQITNTTERKEDVDRITTIFAIDHGERETLSGPRVLFVELENRNPTDIVSLIHSIAEKVNIPISNISIQPQNIKRPILIYKSFSDTMDELAESFGFSWFVFNGSLNVYDEKKGISVGEVIKINSSVGMLESPVIKDRGIDIKMLMEPSIKQGEIFSVESEGVQDARTGIEVTGGITNRGGLQVVESLIHTGDTHGTSWYTEISGRNYIL